jgi:hypothetical protein
MPEKQVVAVQPIKHGGAVHRPGETFVCDERVALALVGGGDAEWPAAPEAEEQDAPPDDAGLGGAAKSDGAVVAEEGKATGPADASAPGDGEAAEPAQADGAATPEDPPSASGMEGSEAAPEADGAATEPEPKAKGRKGRK